ncbi:hypothetical protein [Pseudomonas koreensis]|uniref:hypothetical protein n=1 Tax=Pseudomonas koreensis TaxID=198620 RepID=UPI0020774162|nr:hypothetical protein [Pseudomonas koreensis]MCM8743299.1 hypothetical protein [Pseudomonas koreensis]
MNTQDLIKNLENNIQYKFKKIEILYKQRCKTNNKYLNDCLNLGVKNDEDNSILNQALSDAILNSMASLIDYYCICCMLKIGAAEDKVRKIQYRSSSNSFLIDKSSLSKPEKLTATIDTLRSDLRAKLSVFPNIESVNVNDYWTAFLGDAISYTLKEYGVLESSAFKFKISEKKGQLEIDSRVKQYFYYMEPLFCNAAIQLGLKYSIYIDINNFLKHNAVPFLSPQIDTFGAEQRIYSYFEIKSAQSAFLKDGILKDLVVLSFDEVKSELEIKQSNEDDYDLCQLEEKWGLGAILTIDRTNGFISSNKEFLHFYIGGILIAKSEHALLIEADECLWAAILDLHRELLPRLKYNFN